MFFFFEQKTAYELRISDGSSGVCSSDLAANCPATPIVLRTWCASRTTSCPATRAEPPEGGCRVARIFTRVVLPAPFGPSKPKTIPGSRARSKIGRAPLGQECVNKCRSRWSPHHTKKKKKHNRECR